MRRETGKRYEAIAIGVSAGGLNALLTVLPPLGADLPVPVLVVQHLSPDADDFLVRHLDERSPARVKEAEDKERLEPGTVYVAPAGYHLMVDEGRFAALSVDERVNFSRPSVDVLFETAAEAYPGTLIGVILTGANNDGAAGLAAVKALGGLAVVQDPAGAEAEAMPKAALEAVQADHVVPLAEIGALLRRLVTEVHHG